MREDVWAAETRCVANAFPFPIPPSAGPFHSRFSTLQNAPRHRVRHGELSSRTTPYTPVEAGGGERGGRGVGWSHKRTSCTTNRRPFFHNPTQLALVLATALAPPAAAAVTTTTPSSDDALATLAKALGSAAVAAGTAAATTAPASTTTGKTAPSSTTPKARGTVDPAVQNALDGAAAAVVRGAAPGAAAAAAGGANTPAGAAAQLAAGAASDPDLRAAAGDAATRLKAAGVDASGAAQLAARAAADPKFRAAAAKAIASATGDDASNVQAALDAAGPGLAAVHDAAAVATGKPTSEDATTAKMGPLTATVGSRPSSAAVAAGAANVPSTKATVGPLTFSIGDAAAGGEASATAAVAKPTAAAAVKPAAAAATKPAAASTATSDPLAAIFNAARTVVNAAAAPAGATPQTTTTTSIPSTAAAPVAPKIDPVQAVTNPGGEELEPVGTKSRAGRTRAAAAANPISGGLMGLADALTGRKVGLNPQPAAPSVRSGSAAVATVQGGKA